MAVVGFGTDAYGNQLDRATHHQQAKFLNDCRKHGTALNTEADREHALRSAPQSQYTKQARQHLYAERIQHDTYEGHKGEVVAKVAGSCGYGLHFADEFLAGGAGGDLRAGFQAGKQGHMKQCLANLGMATLKVGVNAAMGTERGLAMAGRYTIKGLRASERVVQGTGATRLLRKGTMVFSEHCPATLKGGFDAAVRGGRKLEQAVLNGHHKMESIEKAAGEHLSHAAQNFKAGVGETAHAVQSRVSALSSNVQHRIGAFASAHQTQITAVGQKLAPVTRKIAPAAEHLHHAGTAVAETVGAGARLVGHGANGAKKVVSATSAYAKAHPYQAEAVNVGVTYKNEKRKALGAHQAASEHAAPPAHKSGRDLLTEAFNAVRDSW